MQISELATTSRQLGNKILELRGGKINGYNITAYRGYTPTECELARTIENPADKVLSWDTAYDLIFGAPTQKPDFTKSLN